MLNMNGPLLAFIFLWLFRYTRFIVNAVSQCFVKAIPINPSPFNSPKDVTVIIPTVTASGYEFFECLRSILDSNPHQVFVVTLHSNIKAVCEYCKLHSIQNVLTIGVDRLDKRCQMVLALKCVWTRLTVFADDDVVWPNRYLMHLLAPFDDPTVGATGTRQRVKRGISPNFWTFLGISYIERRNWNTSATNIIDGSISTLSGRTAAYRTCILQNKSFYETFLNDHFLGKRLNSDDDKCLTRWTFSKGWQIRLQMSEESVILTSLHGNSKFLSQCVRWARAHWRGNLTVMMKNDYWFRSHPWGLYAIYIASFQTPAFIIDGFLLYFLHRACLGEPLITYRTFMSMFAGWLLFTKTIKLIPHFLRHPTDLRFLPVSLIFGYLHGFINIYALMTLHVTTWNGRSINAGDAAE